MECPRPRPNWLLFCPPPNATSPVPSPLPRLVAFAGPKLPFVKRTVFGNYFNPMVSSSALLSVYNYARPAVVREQMRCDACCVHRVTAPASSLRRPPPQTHTHSDPRTHLRARVRNCQNGKGGGRGGCVHCRYTAPPPTTVSQSPFTTRQMHHPPPPPPDFPNLLLRHTYRPN